MILTTIRQHLRSLLKNGSVKCFGKNRHMKRFSSQNLEEEKLDPVQKALLLEQCILVDEKDEVLGYDTKRNCHRIQSNTCPLHRAFSVFLFNSSGELLLQQRSKAKITFPECYTNTCCSHPLYTPAELVAGSALGVKHAAQRRLEIELGIPSSQVPLNEFQYLTRIHYEAHSDQNWGEHELDYILIIQKDVDLKPNLNEVQDIRYITRDGLKDFLADLEKRNVLITPWFRLIANSFLPQWWENLHDLSPFMDHENIHKM